MKNLKNEFLWDITFESKGYRLYSPISGKVITSRGAKFNEEEPWNWTYNCVNNVRVQHLPYEGNFVTSPQENQDHHL